MKYKGQLIKRSGSNFTVHMLNGARLFAEIAASKETAKKWIDAHLNERRHLQAEYLKIQGAIDFNG